MDPSGHLDATDHAESCLYGALRKITVINHSYFILLKLRLLVQEGFFIPSVSMFEVRVFFPFLFSVLRSYFSMKSMSYDKCKHMIQHSSSLAKKF